MYVKSKKYISGIRSKGRYYEKFCKIFECLEHITKKDDILLSDIDYNITSDIARMLSRYPLYRNQKYKDMSLDDIYKLKC